MHSSKQMKKEMEERKMNNNKKIKKKNEMNWIKWYINQINSN